MNQRPSPDKLQDLYTEMKSIRKVSAHFGVSYDTVRRWLKEDHVQLNPQGFYERKELSDDDIDIERTTKLRGPAMRLSKDGQAVVLANLVEYRRRAIVLRQRAILSEMPSLSSWGE